MRSATTFDAARHGRFIRATYAIHPHLTVDVVVAGFEAFAADRPEDAADIRAGRGSVGRLLAGDALPTLSEVRAFNSLLTDAELGAGWDHVAGRVSIPMSDSGGDALGNAMDAVAAAVALQTLLRQLGAHPSGPRVVQALGHIDACLAHLGAIRAKLQE